MAIANATTTTTVPNDGSLQLDSIPIVDLRLLSQSELYSLSLCSSSAFDPNRWDDVVIPKIDRSVFNESAGSRKQTYSRLRLAPPSSSSSATPRRRTPHLRPTAATLVNSSNNNSDPENAENAHIVTLLKKLFVSDINPGELVPVKVEYSHSLLPQQLLSLNSYSASNVGLTGHKRKRGCLGQNKLLGNDIESTVGVSVVDVNDNLHEFSSLNEIVVHENFEDRDREVYDNLHGFSSLNEIVVHENFEDRDREVLNRDGVAVDFVALEAVDHPYWEEIRRRTEGLGTEEELLGFLKGLKGQWGSRRKKKRIVDGSDFGSALPIGWKLLLAVKKKNGHVWLYCRRYISPSGRQFMSCKEASSYLLTLHGVQDTHPSTSAQHNEIADDRLTSIRIADIATQDVDRKENLFSHTSSPAFASTSGNHEMQVILDAGDLHEERLGEILHCDKCNITFSEKDEFLQHRSSVHRRNRYKNGVRITDGVIIKEGKYECQFCHKTFTERHRYNGHIGAHVRYQSKIAGESQAVGVGESVDPISLIEFPVRDTKTKGSFGSDDVAEVGNAITTNVLNFCSSCNKDNEHLGDLREANGNARGVDEATDMLTATGAFSTAEVREASDHALVNGCTAEIIADASSLQERAGNCSPLPFDDETHGVMNGIIENSASIEKPKQDMVSESSLFNSNNQVEACDIVVNNGHICQTRNELKVGESFVVNESILELFGSRGVQDKDIVVSVKQPRNFEDLPCKIIDTTDNTSMASKLNLESNISMLALSRDEKGCAEDNVPCSVGKYTVDETSIFRSCEKGSSEADDVSLNRHDEMQFGNGSVIPSWNKQESMPGKYDTEVFTCLLKEPGVQNTSKSSLVAFSGHESNCGADNNDGEVCGRKMEILEFDSIQSDPFSSHTAVNFNSMTGTEQDRKFGVCSATKQFFTEENVIRVFDSALEEHKQESSRSVLLSENVASEVSDEANTMNKTYATHANLTISEIAHTGKHGLSLSFGNLQTELHTDSNRVEQERYLAESFNIQSDVHKIYGDQTHSSIINSHVPGNLKQERRFGIDFRDSSFNNRTHELGSSFNVPHQGRDWNGPRGDNIPTSGQNFMVDFGDNSAQSGDCILAHGSWSTGHENVFQGCFDAVSNPQVQSSSCFGTFNLTSDKAEEVSFGVRTNYDIRTDILRPGRTEPVEYSFMGEQSSNSLPGESKIFSPNTNLEQGLDPSVWLGKDALMPNTAHNNRATSVCVWCRSLFYQEQVQPGIPTGAIGSLCPSCSTRIPVQFNVL
ncbi:hypothetical protein Pfo_016701 [Paulownia fortunei]|nr:hypothetical protein Pfo_016701 [Paulownia fortunei]